MILSCTIPLVEVRFGENRIAAVASIRTGHVVPVRAIAIFNMSHVELVCFRPTCSVLRSLCGSHQDA